MCPNVTIVEYEWLLYLTKEFYGMIYKIRSTPQRDHGETLLIISAEDFNS